MTEKETRIKEALSALKPEDRVYVRRTTCGRLSSCVTAQVERLTKTQIILDTGDRFWRVGGKHSDWRIGEQVSASDSISSFASRILPDIPECREGAERDRAATRRYALIRHLENYDYKKVPTSALEQIDAILKEAAADAEETRD